MSFVAIQMDLGIIMSGEISQRKEDKYHMLSLICGILKNDTNELIYKTEIDSQTNKTKLWLQKGDRGDEIN